MRAAGAGLVLVAGTAALVVGDARQLEYRTPQVIDLQQVAGAERALNTALGDIDGDGRADVVAVDDGSPLYAFLGTPDGGVEEKVTLIDEQYRTLRGQGLLQAVDGDGDGDVDILASAQNDAFLFYRNDGGGTFTEIRAPRGDEILAGGVAVFDLGGDGDLDVVVSVYRLPTRTDEGIRVFENLGSSFAPAQRLLVPNGGPTPRAADMNGDGLDDIVLVRSAETHVYLQDVEGQLVALTPAPHGTGTPSGVVLDVDGDLDLDVIAYNRLQRNDGSGALTEDPSWSIAGYTSKAPVVVDFDNDGLDDIVDLGTGIEIELRRNTGGAFGEPEEIPSGQTLGNSARFAVGDADEDGRADLVLANYSSTVLSISRQAGNPAPQDLTVAPQVIDDAGPVDLDLTGQGLMDGATVDLGTGIVATSVVVSSPNAARAHLVVAPGIGGGRRTLKLVNPDLQVTSAPVDVRSIDVDPLGGRLYDTLAPARDVLKVSGRFPRNDLSAHDAFVGAEQGLRIEIGSGFSRFALETAAGDARWKVVRRGRRLVFETLRDQYPRVRIVVNERRQKFSLRVTHFDYPQAPEDATVRILAGSDEGQGAAEWRLTRRARRYVLR
jgi:hypothetical protein